jgi:nicotinate-nucleotide pyrophosphorylase (carboxylating)
MKFSLKKKWQRLPDNLCREWLKLVVRLVQKLNQKYINTIVKKALNEDLKPQGDITTNLIQFKNKKIKAKIIAKQGGIIAGLDLCKTAFKLIGKETIFINKVIDGSKVKKNKVIAEVEAKIKTILTAERTALNFLNHASGIATLTDQFVKKVNKRTKICCTRKTTPNLRLLEKYAVKKGGGHNHRYNLSDEILIKENHISVENNLRNLIKKAIKTKKIVTVEIENLNQLKQVLGLKFKRILFDNMSSKQLKKCLKLCKNKYETEYSGNAELKNIKKISNTGINRISVGAITHSKKSFDSSLLLS